MFVFLLHVLILGFSFSNFTRETGEFELALTITPVLQANRLTKCASDRLTKSARDSISAQMCKYTNIKTS